MPDRPGLVDYTHHLPYRQVNILRRIFLRKFGQNGNLIPLYPAQYAKLSQSFEGFNVFVVFSGALFY